MKKIIQSITIDYELHVLARQSDFNISGFCNDCLKSILLKRIEKRPSDIIQKELTIAEETINLNLQRKAILTEELTELKREEKRIIEEKAREQDARRWVCLSCKTKNLMDAARCIGCGFPNHTKNKEDKQ